MGYFIKEKFKQSTMEASAFDSSVLTDICSIGRSMLELHGVGYYENQGQIKFYGPDYQARKSCVRCHSTQSRLVEFAMDFYHQWTDENRGNESLRMFTV